MPKKNTNKELTQINGKDAQYQPTTLDQITGDTGFFQYHTMDENEYLNYLNGLVKYDLFEHASSVSVMPNDNRERLINQLLNEFRRHVNSYRQPKVDLAKPKIPAKNFLYILAEGR